MIKIPAPIFSRVERESGSQFGREERESRKPEEPPEGAHVIRSTKFVTLPTPKHPADGDQKTSG